MISKIQAIINRSKNYCVSCGHAVRGTGTKVCGWCETHAPCSAGIRNEMRLAGMHVPDQTRPDRPRRLAAR